MNISDYTLNQIAVSFLIVILCAIAFITVVLPKIITASKNINTLRTIWINSKKKKSDRIAQIKQNTEDIHKTNEKLDKLVDTLNVFIEDNKRTNKDIINSVNDVKRDMLDSKLDKYRSEILDFANSCKNGRKHTPNEFMHIIDLGGKYDKLIEKYELDNGVFETEFAYIKRTYDKCLDNNEFLD